MQHYSSLKKINSVHVIAEDSIMARYTRLTQAKSMNSAVMISEMSLHVQATTHTLMVHRTFVAIGDIR